LSLFFVLKLEMKCERCGNSDINYFYKGSKGYYCRKCVKFKRIILQEEMEPLDYEVAIDAGDYAFSYELTSKQKLASLKCLKALQSSDVLLYCVTGAGKTEIVVESIAYYLKQAKKVCYAISRKEVVIELTKRFQKIFKNTKVVSVYGNHHDEINGDLIVCTTHQLFRYYKTFDLLVLDEVDAYPLKGNNTLMNIAYNSCIGHIIYSTATIDKDLQSYLAKRNYQTVELYSRPSNKPLIEPKVVRLNVITIYLYLYKLLKQMSEQCIIFVQTKKQCETLYKLYSLFFKCTYVYSDLDKRRENIDNFRNKNYQYIFATTVLERGISINDINVIIINFEKGLFDESNLVQMVGRVGRNYLNPYGKAYILTLHKDKEINKTISYIRKANTYLWDVYIVIKR